ncbi:hypothetical protein AB0F11_02325 [Streptomyces sp. NPDC032472]|uniref:hypothetical protein n=1 Tax=Streptomyces sp. NPDC032472 TaxID=3155018 RepID=UPI0033CD367D
MAYDDLSAAQPAAAHPMANPGYGKRDAPGQAPRTGDDFAHLPKDEAALAWFIERLPEGAAIDHKTLSARIDGLGQAGCRGLLHRLVDSGHLCLFRERVVLPSSSRWVTRTYFSRTQRDRGWWLEYCKSIGAEPLRLPPKELAYQALARLKEADPQLVLSAAECEELAPLAERWLERGVTVAELTQSLTAGLPRPVHNAAALIRSRLEPKMPPEQPAVETDENGEEGVVVERYFACMFCEQDERTVRIVNGLCPQCLLEMNCEHCKAVEAEVEELRERQTFRAAGPTPEEVRKFADIVREAGGLLPRGRV